MNIFFELESEVRNYCRSFPVIFEKAKGYFLFDINGKKYIDFFSGAGSLNYGHNHPQIQKKLIEYIQNDNVINSLDMATVAKKKFIERFNKVILEPGGYDYKFQFTGPTGTNAVEAALKLARIKTGRTPVVFFINAFHGVTLGSLSVTYNPFKRSGAGINLHNTVELPYDESSKGFDTIETMELYLQKAKKGCELPAAVILETIQGEGGVHLASNDWLLRLERLLKEYNVLMIVDDIQSGCGRTGTFFSFENAGIKPDIVCLSKSLSGYGLPLSLVLLKREHDVWKPGGHCGSFRGSNPAFITATEALSFWETDELSKSIMEKSEWIKERLTELLNLYPNKIKEIRGRGLMWGIECVDAATAATITETAFKKGLIVEKTGFQNKVIKLMPPLIIDKEALINGINIISECISYCYHHHRMN
ncbi:MAG: diaminobutyrate--2-oxoglutarate transaminase [Candidatus Magnetomorum sp.]|nr:diaminobutyrate--2-oxoglutarate transaminase [Candidatus Magnetomorum sp.]